MTRKGKFILAGATAVVIGAAAAGAVAQRGNWKHEHGPGAFRGGGLMGLAGFSGPGFHRICRGNGPEMVDHMMVRLDHKVNPTDAQRGAFEDLRTAARTATERLKTACPPEKADSEDKPRQRLSPIERLDRTQAQLEASLEAVKTVRPAAEKFYASLDADQKAKFAERRGHGRHRDRMEKDGKAEPDAQAPDAQSPPERE